MSREACMWTLGCASSKKETDPNKVVSKAIISGHIKKMGVGVWNTRWCSLQESDLLYFTENNLTIPKGRIDMHNSKIYDELSGMETEFQIQTRGRVHFFQALNLTSKNKWMIALRTASEVEESSSFFKSEILVVSPKLVTRVCNVVDVNSSAKMIKIHYSGFPTIYDEWIRSDSSRIVSDFEIGEVIEAEQPDGTWVHVIVEKATPGGYFIQYSPDEPSQPFGITKLRRSQHYEKAGGTAYNAGDFCQALFWFHLHKRCYYNQPYKNIDSATRSIHDQNWNDFPSFLNDRFEKNIITEATKWKDVQNMWMQHQEEDSKTGQVILEGHLKKLGKFMWNTRWCVLDGEMLLYYMSKDSKSIKGCIHMPSAEVHDRQSKSKMEFQIQIKERTHYFMTRGLENKRKWTDALQKASRDEFEVSFRFLDNEDNPWGCEVDWEKPFYSWVVEKIHEEKQADCLGVQIGDKIHSVDDILVDELTSDSIRAKLRTGHSCVITFLRTRANVMC